MKFPRLKGTLISSKIPSELSNPQKFQMNCWKAFPCFESPHRNFTIENGSFKIPKVFFLPFQKTPKSKESSSASREERIGGEYPPFQKYKIYKMRIN